MLLRIDRRGAALALAEMAWSVFGTRPGDGARLAGAAAGLLAGPGPEAPAERARIEQVAQIVGVGHDAVFAAGGRLDDDALIELSIAV